MTAHDSLAEGNIYQPLEVVFPNRYNDLTCSRLGVLQSPSEEGGLSQVHLPDRDGGINTAMIPLGKTAPLELVRIVFGGRDPPQLLTWM